MAPDSHHRRAVPIPSASEQDALRERELSQILRAVLRVRVALLPIFAAFLSLIVLYDAQRWKSLALVPVLVLELVVGVFDARRLLRGQGYAMAYLDADLLAMVLLQTAVIWLTGALESPLVVIYVPLAQLLGIVLGPGPRRWRLLGLMLVFLWAMTLLPLWGLLPRTVPTFLDMGPGFAQRPIYALTKCAIITVVVLLASTVGTAVFRSINRMLSQALGARRQALESLSDRNRELTYLSSAIAHELKNPLASVHGLAQLLGRPGADPSRSAKRLEVLQREVERMRGTLDDFLNFTRPLGELTVQQVQPTELLEQLATLHEGLARERGIELELAGHGAPAIRADPRKLKQALVNLLQNAIEATPRGGRVQLSAHADGAELVLAVRDSGPGLAPEVAQRATQAGVTTKEEGSGIGLAVARSIAEQHGGQLTLQGGPDGGCEALLRLPPDPPQEETTS